ncbi:MAG: hypothetical protein RPU34_06530, partial [Candidatus Sedimenticola sp. (ex Thyasira tokunagai)]
PLTGRRVRMPTLLPLWRAARTTGKQCGLTATGDYQPSLRSPWLAANVCHVAWASARPPQPCDTSFGDGKTESAAGRKSDRKGHLS